MRRDGIKRRYTLGVVPSLGVAAALSITTALGATSAGAFTTHPSAVATSGPTSKVIVFMRDTLKGLAPHTAARASQLHALEAPILSQLRLSNATHISTLRTLPIILASVNQSEKSALLANPNVIAVLPDVHINNPARSIITAPRSLVRAGRAQSHISAPLVCGTPSAPELDPEAIGVIKADQAFSLGYTGAGITVAYIADGVNPANPDFSRNAAYASGGSGTGSPVVTQVNFTGDPSGIPTAGGEAFLDSSSIGAQGNTVYDISSFVSPAHPTPSSPCDIKIVGAAPGANVMGLDVFSSANDTTESNFIQAIDYAVAHGVKVLNESFGANQFPDTALDATRLADDAATAAGVTVVVSSGDAGISSTIGSPATDPNVISVGASTTFRAYQQVTNGGINDPNANGTWINNNISSISSGGFSMGNTTVNLVAPGDLNWTLCDANNAMYQDCTDYSGNGSPIAISGGTSESSPLTAGAAADVIQAYVATHSGAYPSPALVKQILVSTATDVSAPAEQQGAGLLNVLAAVKVAASMAGTTVTPSGGLLISPSQINVGQNPGSTVSKPVSVTNNGVTPVVVHLSTRALTKIVSNPSGMFCLNPSAVVVAGCGPPTVTTFQIASGATEVYQEETFSVPHMTSPSRLNFSATYPYTGQSSLLHVALIDPSGAYAGYSLPQGLADYANVQVANPRPGLWTAVFFTVQDGVHGSGTVGTIQWQATNSKFQAAGLISPSTLNIAPGATASATFTTLHTVDAGDTAQSVVLSTVGGATNTIPVTVRTLIAIGPHGGNFHGILTGGNGRGNPAQTNTYAFTVPRGQHDLDVSALFADANDAVVAFLVDPHGQTVASSSSVTYDSLGTTVIGTPSVNVYATNPAAGNWQLVLDWLQPVSGDSISDPFVGAVRFNQVSISANLPTSSSYTLLKGQSYTFNVTVTNTGVAAQRFFLDPRTLSSQSIALSDLNGSDQSMALPLAPGFNFPVYSVPTHTSVLASTLIANAPVSFDVGPFTGDPDVSSATPSAGAVVSQSGNTASVTLSEPNITTGLWFLNPSEIGPYGPLGAPAVTASASVIALTKGFDTTVSSPTGDLWRLQNLVPGVFAPVYVLPGASVVIPVTITPAAAKGTVISGNLNVDDAFQVNLLAGLANTGGDELISLPFTYKVG